MVQITKIIEELLVSLCSLFKKTLNDIVSVKYLFSVLIIVKYKVSSIWANPNEFKKKFLSFSMHFL